ncbi:hypothetical protein LshimejAT787_0804310 [Lyophyllum shimeji]|uniref:DUF6533 domain-containing protein n=1 Tax=Lyophyllum shimeji TaxID=47721 RepID=A0A9P3PQ35_LYOSH|nr:hypothetical protein LshimejAT787_0804310 [Lyophyllum shimeji]
MSFSPDLLAAAEHIATKSQIGRYVIISLYVVQVCEWVASLDDELNLIHCAKWTAMKFAYLCCRYYPLLTWLMYIWALAWDHDIELCLRIVKPLYILMVPYQMFAQAVMVTRAWAFTGRQSVVLLILLSAYAVMVGMDVWVFATDVESVMLQPVLRNTGLNSGCVRDSNSGRPPIPFKLGLLFMSAFFLDFLGTIIMISHCIRLRSFQGQLGKIFLKQGLVAFLFMSALHITAATCAFTINRFGSTFIAAVPLILANVVACRLTLSLRKNVAIGTETEQLAELSRVVRNAMADASDSPSDAKVYDIIG